MPIITRPNQHFDTTTYTASASYPRTITNSGGMQPDLVWIKSRTQAYSHYLFDSVRGTGAKGLSSNLTSAEGADAGTSISSFNSNGYTISAGDAISDTSAVAWQWKAGGTSTVNTSGTISSNVSVNTTARFSIVTYTGNGTGGATVGHGLGLTPKMIIAKGRGNTDNWPVYHASANASPATGHLLLNSTAAFTSTSTTWNNTAPTSTVFSVGTDPRINQNTIGYVAYCFAEVEGFSRFGSYVGNGSSPGPFVYLGFRPEFIMAKSTSASRNWIMFDSIRDPFNTASARLFSNTFGAESTNEQVLFLSNGFQMTTNTFDGNTNGETYIYMAFAEAPFKYANAR